MGPRRTASRIWRATSGSGAPTTTTRASTATDHPTTRATRAAVPSRAWSCAGARTCTGPARCAPTVAPASRRTTASVTAASAAFAPWSELGQALARGSQAGLARLGRGDFLAAVRELGLSPDALLVRVHALAAVLRALGAEPPLELF